MRHRFDPSHRRLAYGSGWVTDPHLRVSDAERNEVAERLSRHFADGRLDQTEFTARLDRATGAITRGDLDGLFDDLPRLADEPSPPRARRRRLVPLLLVVVLVAMAADSVRLHGPRPLAPGGGGRAAVLAPLGRTSRPPRIRPAPVDSIRGVGRGRPGHRHRPDRAHPHLPRRLQA